MLDRHLFNFFDGVRLTCVQDTYAAAKVQLRSSTCSEVEIPLTDGEHKVRKKKEWKTGRVCRTLYE